MLSQYLGKNPIRKIQTFFISMIVVNSILVAAICPILFYNHAKQEQSLKNNNINIQQAPNISLKNLGYESLSEEMIYNKSDISTSKSSNYELITKVIKGDIFVFLTILILNILLLVLLSRRYLKNIIDKIYEHAHMTSMAIEETKHDLDISKKTFEQDLIYSPIGKALVSLEGKFIKVNKALCDLIGYPEKELLNLDFQTITHPDDLDQDLNYVSQLINDEIKTYQMDKRYYKKNGDLIWIQLNASLVRDDNNKPEYFIAQIQDITKRKSDESDKKHMIDELLDKNKELDDFAYIISHDLKEPLRGISNYSSFILEDYKDKLDDEGVYQLNKLIDLTTRMSNQLNDLLHYSRVSRAVKIVKNVDIMKLVQNIITSLKIIYVGQDIDFRIVNKLPKINCEKVYVNELYTNLLTNAVKYNTKQNKIIEIGAINDQIFYVKDNGIGIKRSHKEKVFEIFKRLNHKSKFGDGNGFGLTIAKKIVERHGGDIWLDSEYGSWTTFYFTLADSTSRRGDCDAQPVDIVNG